MRRYLHASVTRITDLEHRPFEIHALPRDRWETADYVLVEVLGPSHYPFEIANGRLVDAVAGDLVIGALGQRSATLEVVGDWHSGKKSLAALLLFKNNRRLSRNKWCVALIAPPR